MKTLRTFLMTVALLSFALPAQATLLESWENSGVSGIGGDGPWSLMMGATRDLSVGFSKEHASEGEYCLKVYTPGGWEPVLINDRNFTSAVADRSLRQVLGEKLILSVDVYADTSLTWATLVFCIQGDGMEWTQLTSEPLHIGGFTKVRFLIDKKLFHCLRKNNNWMQFMIYVNSSGKGTLYLDNLRAD